MPKFIEAGIKTRSTVLQTFFGEVTQDLILWLAQKQQPLNGCGISGSKSETFFCIITPALSKKVFVKSHASQNINIYRASNQ